MFLLQRLRGTLPFPLLELIHASSVSRPPIKLYHVHRPTVTPDVELPRPSDMLSRLSEALSRSEDEVKLAGTEVELFNTRLSNLRLALGEKNIVYVLNTYNNPDEHYLLASLTGRDWSAISIMLHEYLTQLADTRYMVPGIKEMVVNAAAKGYTAGLKTCMLLHVLSGDTKLALSLYDEYAVVFQHISTSPRPENAVISDELKESEENEGDEESRVMNDTTFLNEVPEERLSYQGAADIVLIMIASLVKEDRFHDAFDRFLATPSTVRLPSSKTRAFCKAHFFQEVSLSKKLQTWVQELVLLRLVSRHTSLNNYIMGLAGDKQIPLVHKLYSDIIGECRKPDGRISATSEASPNSRGGTDNNQRNVVMSGDSWSVFIQAFFRCNRADLVGPLWDDVVGLGLTPNLHMWTALIDGYGRHAQCEQSKVIWNRMIQAGIEPNHHTYGAMISAYFISRRPQEGLALFEQLQTIMSKTVEKKKVPRDASMLPLYNLVLHGLCTNAMDDRARTLMKEMMDYGPKPDIVSYNTFLRHYGRIGDMKSLAAVLRGIQQAGVQMDVRSFTTVLSALYKGGKQDAHQKLLSVMEAMGIKPNVAMYSAIIDFLVRQGGRENFLNANLLLQMMELHADKDCRPNEVTYTGILAGIHRDPSISAQDVRSYTADLFARMHRNGTLPNRTTYHYLIKASLENPEALGLQMALSYYREMQTRGFQMTKRSWYVLLSGLLRRGEVAIANEVVREMTAKGHEPDDPMRTLIQRIRRELTNRGG